MNASLFAFYLPGAAQYDQGKNGTSEQRQVNLIDNLSVTKGGHQLKFGADYRWHGPSASRILTGSLCSFRESLLPRGGVLSGTASLAITSTFQGDALLSNNVSLYRQDTWKITPLLTLTYGLRWDVNPALKGKNRANDPFTVTGLDNPATLALAPRGTPLYETTYRNVAPRVGLGWQIGRGATLRAGVGVFYDLGQGSVGAASSYFPYLATKTISPSPVPFPLSSQGAAAPPISLTPVGTTIQVTDPHLKLPRSYQWNVAVEKAIGNNETVSLTYIGAIGRDLLRVTRLQNPNPSFSSVGLTTSTATSDYHPFQLKFERRLSRGLQAQAWYSFSHFHRERLDRCVRD